MNWLNKKRHFVDFQKILSSDGGLLNTIKYGHKFKKKYVILVLKSKKTLNYNLCFDKIELSIFANKDTILINIPHPCDQHFLNKTHKT